MREIKIDSESRDGSFSVEKPDGKVIRMRLKRPRISDLKTPADKKLEMREHDEFAARMKDNDPERTVSYPSYKARHYDEPEMFGDIGSPESIEVSSDSPKVLIANVRHLRHEDNVVGEEEKQNFRTRAESLLDDLNIDEETLVCVMASSSGTYVAGDGGISKNSRTESTLDVIRDVLRERGVSFIDGGVSPKDTLFGERSGPVSLELRKSLDEFPVADRMVNIDAKEKAAANKKAKAAGEEEPYPNTPEPVNYASRSSNLSESEEKTGIAEVGSATVARGFRGFDALEKHHLVDGNMPDGVKRVVVIVTRHGQFMSGLLGTFAGVTDGKFPGTFASNGAYFIVKAGLDNNGKVVEEYRVETGDRTGIKEW